MKRSPMKRKPGAMAAADKAFSLFIRARDPVCQANGTDGVMCNSVIQCAHIIRRRYRAVRWSEQNAIGLCQAHHYYYTTRELEWQEWVDANQPTGLSWDELKWLALNDPPEKADEALARLRGAA